MTMIVVINIFLVLALIFVLVTTMTMTARTICKRHDKYQMEPVGSIKSLPSMSFVKSGLYFGYFAPSYNPEFHFAKFPLADLILPPAFYC